MPKYRRGSGSVYLKRGWCYSKYSLGLRAEKITRKPYIPPLEVNNARQLSIERNRCRALLSRVQRAA
jgi:hypothetical protein